MEKVVLDESSLKFVTADAEFASLIENKNWAETEIGVPVTWPQSLRTTLSIVFNNPSPMLLVWGKSKICFYNQAYRPFLGDDNNYSASFGSSLDQFSGENWKSILPIIDSILEGGQGALARQDEISIYKNGKAYTDYCKLTYNPVHDETGQSAAVLITIIENSNQPVQNAETVDKDNEFKLLVNHIPILSWIADAGGNIYWFNKQWYTYTGTTESEMMHGGWTSVHDSKVFPVFLQKWNESIENKEPFEMVFPLKNAKGEYNHFLTRMVPHHNQEGEIQKWFGTNTDITTQKVALDALSESETHFYNTVKQAPIAFMISRTKEYTIEIANDAYLDIVGKEEIDFVGYGFFEIFPELEAVHKPILDTVYDTGIPFEGKETKVEFLKNGVSTTGYFDFLYYPVREKDGRVSGIISTGYEVTEEVIRRNKIEGVETRFRSLVSQSPIAMVVFTGSDHIVELLNNAMLKRWGMTEEQVLGKSLSAIFPGLKGGDFEMLLDEVYATGKPYSGKEVVSYPHKKTEPSPTYIDYEYSPFMDLDGKVSGVITTVTDVTDKVYSRKAIEESEQRFAAAIQAVEGVVWTNNGEGQMIGVQEGWSELTGQTLEEYEGYGWSSCIHPEDAEPTVIAWNEAVREVKTFNFEHRVKTKNNEYRSFSVKAIPLINSNGTVRQWVGVHTDIQYLKEQDQQKDYFISMASHELKTPVTSIKGYVQILQEMYRSKQDEVLDNALKVMDRQVDTLVKLITELLDISKIKLGGLHFKMEQFNMSVLVKNVIEELKNIYPTISFLYEEDQCGVVYGDMHRISQVLNNLLTNAVKYSPNSTDIVVKSICDEEFIFVSVKDAGIGIEKADQAHIFDRFYRVEGKDEKTYPGFGIGLYIAAEIIHKHGGTIEVESEPKKGSVFTFSVPLLKHSGE